MDKKRFTPLLILLSLVSTSQALAAPTDAKTELRVKFGGWSKHLHDLPEVTKQRIDYNESHNGVGLEYIIKNPAKNTYKGIGMMYMKDSYNKPAFTFGGNMGFYADFAKDFSTSIGLVAGLQDRSYIETVGDIYVDTKRTIVPFVAPELTFSYKNFGASAIVFPHVVEENDKLIFKKPVIFTQFFYNF